MVTRYRDRRHAGVILSGYLSEYANRPDVLVLGLVRGGVEVGDEVAAALRAPLDVMLVRKLGTPGQEELAMGAIATGGARVLNEDIVAGLGITADQLEAIARMEQQELHRREQAYRGDRPPPELAGRCVILVDDGLATGATMAVAVQAARQQQPNEVVVAVPVAPPEAVQRLGELADRVICPLAPDVFLGVGYWYEQFGQLSDDDVRAVLWAAWGRGERAA